MAMFYYKNQYSKFHILNLYNKDWTSDTTYGNINACLFIHESVFAQLLSRPKFSVRLAMLHEQDS